VRLPSSSPEGVLEGLPARVASLVGKAYGDEVGAWAGRAAESFRAQLADNGALPHRFVTDLYAPSLAFEASEVGAIGDALDVLQVSFDLADNVADRELDVSLGRSYMRSCEDVPLAVLTYLPAVLASRGIAILHEHFRGDRFNATFALAKTSAAVGAMLRGQAEPPGSPLRVELLSGRQGLLLCLPLWLLVDRRELPCSVSDFEAWAYQFGCTWELNQVHVAEKTETSGAAWREAVASARLSWPSFGPFAADGPLAPRAALPGCLC
jgi:hypothetical protein